MADLWTWLSWIGTTLFAVSLLPQAVRTWHRKHAEDFSTWFLWTVLAASIFMMLYMFSIPNVYAALGFVANLVVWGMVLWFRLFPGAQTRPE